MCGRSASSRNSEKIRHACAYRPRGRKEAVKPNWIDCSSLKYYPSYNISPQMNTAVLLSGSHPHVKSFCQRSSTTDDSSLDAAVGDRVLQPMKWGLVPSWRKTETTKTSSSSPLLNNCRLEGILEKPSFRNAIEKRRRCVVLVDGFFEWDRSGKQKRPYFIHFRNNAPTAEMDELDEGKNERDDGLCDLGGGVKVDQNVVNGRLLTMAGLFDIATETHEAEALYTFTVITVEAHPDFSHIHDRMPAILDGDEAIQTWLDPTLPSQEAIKILHPSASLMWYPVSDVVNNVRNKTPECIMKIDPCKQVSSKQKTLFSWFSKPIGQDTNEEKISHQEDKDSNKEKVSPPAKRSKIIP